ncbi:MAG: hypothetical protein IJ774_01255 [Selenomonadaceae bacterium]|nr:hypothetical protein [Selenomonadaceae bacterium]
MKKFSVEADIERVKNLYRFENESRSVNFRLPRILSVMYAFRTPKSFARSTPEAVAQ